MFSLRNVHVAGDAIKSVEGSEAIPSNGTDTERNTCRARVVITVQPEQKPKGYKFRYECEGNRAGTIHGAMSTPEYPTYPAIRIDGYRGRAKVVVSCVTKDRPYR